MSFSLTAGLTAARNAAGIAPLFTTWRDELLPASFRGAAFQVRSHAVQGGRRGVVHQFAGSDLPVTEDLGAEARTYEIEAYVVGDGYMSARDALWSAVFETSGPGTLVHPYLGRLDVQALSGCTMHETMAEGGIATFHLRFAESGALRTARASADTAQGVLNRYGTLIATLKTAYATGVVVAGHPGFLLNLVSAGLTSLTGSLLGLPAGTIEGAAYAARQIGAVPADPAATAAALTAAFDAYAAAIVAQAPGPPDYSGGMAALAGWSGMGSPASLGTADLVQQAANAATINRAVQGCATAATAAIYAQTDFVSQADALAARTQLLALIAAQLDAASLANDDASYAAFMDLQAAVAADLATRALALPILGTYAVAAALPSLALAQMLYADASGADALDALNGAMHPLFMPAGGVWLQAA